jgi:hypothetical protein
MRMNVSGMVAGLLPVGSCVQGLARSVFVEGIQEKIPVALTLTLLERGIALVLLLAMAAAGAVGFALDARNATFVMLLLANFAVVDGLVLFGVLTPLQSRWLLSTGRVLVRGRSRRVRRSPWRCTRQ